MRHTLPLPLKQCLPWTSSGVVSRTTFLRPRSAPLAPTRRHFTDAASHPSNKVQFYLSRTNDPYLNLSIEHHLLQKSPPDSTILFLYTNRPCIVVGRNQNPWLEVNLPLIEQLRAQSESGTEDALRMELVRRRSGGGTVFHDGGNVNYCVICPPAVFDRDKHAEMVVRALRRLGVSGAKVNCRHDIVVDVGEANPEAPLKDETACPAGQQGPQTFKVSGSAYKLTRLRSLHHGTCLLSSPNLASISSYLRSPAEPFIKARGVESVRSKVRNVAVGNADFEEAVREEFGKMYGRFDIDLVVGDEARDIPNVQNGLRELQTRDWIYGQTPRFAFSTAPTEDDPRERPELPFDTSIHVDVRQGIIQELSINGMPALQTEARNTSSFFELPSWSDLLTAGGLTATRVDEVAAWLQSLLGDSCKRKDP
ncbi:hypothetical protein SAPIO_CDS1114 [Scedosporium apiospermum]|uniref:Putative lipoate-protein ligase A n=1 Tax=Pseudallescheria apiosperma TaxID=563466 RepID=A0A084GFW5_PSEDA|nr:uncharacterized protein SAPIO_CDS1114 [Scedosporium apiospermum]KEZ46227.1 hypothetical protein SAPIO_CDS1114 [Scedosporium apiospermum]